MTIRTLLAAVALWSGAAVLPLAAKPLTQSALVPFDPNGPQVSGQLQAVQSDTVEQFDPVGRAGLLVSELPRRWRGTYVAYGSGATQPVQLNLASLTAVGQVVVVRGTMTVGSISTLVQGNINAKSDQLDLLLLGDTSAVGLAPGGEFQGLQMFDLLAWQPARLTNPGGKLILTPLAGR